jgi:hypothetical protein
MGAACFTSEQVAVSPAKQSVSPAKQFCFTSDHQVLVLSLIFLSLLFVLKKHIREVVAKQAKLASQRKEGDLGHGEVATDRNGEGEKRRAAVEALFALPKDEFWRQMINCEEDLPSNRRGGAYRWFRSENVVDLLKIRKERAKAG